MPTDPFIDVAALPSSGSIRYLDARDQAAFDAAHAPGAVRVPLEAWDKAAKDTDIGFGKTAFWDDALGALGIDPSVTAVAYDSGAMTNAARVWFILQYYGLKCVILNGGWPALAAASGLPSGAPASPGRIKAAPGAGAVGLVDRETLKQQLDGAAHVFDSRTRAEFTGEDARNRPRGGHIAHMYPSSQMGASRWGEVSRCCCYLTRAGMASAMGNRKKMRSSKLSRAYVCACRSCRCARAPRSSRSLSAISVISQLGKRLWRPSGSSVRRCWTRLLQHPTCN